MVTFPSCHSPKGYKGKGEGKDHGRTSNNCSVFFLPVSCSEFYNLLSQQSFIFLLKLKLWLTAEQVKFPATVSEIFWEIDQCCHNLFSKSG